MKMKKGKKGNSHFYFDNKYSLFPKQKRSQITIFIIIAVAIVAVIVLLFFFRNKAAPEVKVAPELGPINELVRSCIKDTGTFGVYVISAKGGYYFSPDQSIDSGEAYYILNNRSIIPNKKKIEGQLAAYVDVNLRDCLDDFSKLPIFNISGGEINTTTTFENNSFIVDVNYPLSIRKDNSTYTLEEFRGIEIPTNADLMYNVAINYSKIYQETGGISLTYASNLEDDSNIISNFQHYPNYTLVVLTYNQTYEWKFALG